VDRFLPPVDTTGGTLNINITTANHQGVGFYNTQGIQRPANIAGAWTVSGDLTVTPSMTVGSSTALAQRTDLWTRSDNPVENNAFYPIIGITNDGTSRYRVWDSTTGWVDLLTPVTAGVHNLSINYDGVGSINYNIDGTPVLIGQTYDLAFPDLRTVFVEAYNFGGSDYTAQWDNVTASSVPEPASMSILGLSAVGLLIRRRRSA